jgi:hypothetical protein
VVVVEVGMSRSRSRRIYCDATMQRVSGCIWDCGCWWWVERWREARRMMSLSPSRMTIRCCEPCALRLSPPLPSPSSKSSASRRATIPLLADELLPPLKVHSACYWELVLLLCSVRATQMVNVVTMALISFYGARGLGLGLEELRLVRPFCSI